MTNTDHTQNPTSHGKERRDTEATHVKNCARQKTNTSTNMRALNLPLNTVTTRQAPRLQDAFCKGCLHTALLTASAHWQSERENDQQIIVPQPSSPMKFCSHAAPMRLGNIAVTIIIYDSAASADPELTDRGSWPESRFVRTLSALNFSLAWRVNNRRTFIICGACGSMDLLARVQQIPDSASWPYDHV